MAIFQKLSKTVFLLNPPLLAVSTDFSLIFVRLLPIFTSFLMHFISYRISFINSQPLKVIFLGLTIIITIHMSNQTKDYVLVYLRVNGCYFWFNVLQILLTLSMLILLYMQALHFAVVIEIFIAFLIALDLLIRYFTEGFKHFIADWDNRIHFILLLLLILSLAQELAAPQLTDYDQGIVAGVFLFIRYSVQFSRLFKLILDSKKQLQLSQHQTINLNETIEQQGSQRTNQIH